MAGIEDGDCSVIFLFALVGTEATSELRLPILLI